MNILPPPPGFGSVSHLESIGDTLFDDPFDALMFTSALAGDLKPDDSPFSSGEPQPDIREVAEMMSTDGLAVTDLVLLIWERILPEPPLPSGKMSRVRKRTRVTPLWLMQLNQVRPSTAFVARTLAGEYETVFVQFDAPWGSFTAATFTLYSGIAMIEDAFVQPGPFPQDLVKQQEASPSWSDPTEISLADAKALVSDAIHWTSRYIDAPETDTWPHCEALLRWAINKLPDGGEGHAYADYEEEDFARETDAFKASQYADRLDPDALDNVSVLLDLAANYGSGDMTMWSAQLVERMLLDLIPRKVMFDHDSMSAMPESIRALVLYYHDRHDFPDEYTQGVLETLSAFVPDYFGAIDYDEDDDDSDLGGFPFWELFDPKILSVGSQEALDELTDEPLPVEKFFTRGLPRPVAAKAKLVAEAITSLAPGFFDDPEITTSSLRILAKLAAHDPKYFTQKSTGTSRGAVPWEVAMAAAICWVAGKANDWFVSSDPDRTSKAMVQAFGLKTPPSQRANTILGRLPDANNTGYFVYLGDASLLTSAKRKSLLRLVEFSSDEETWAALADE